METSDYTVTLLVDKTPEQVFNAINNVPIWWTGDLEGSSQKLGDEFTVHFGEIHVSTQKLIEIIPNKKVVWLVTESNLNFIKDRQEWNNTKVCFEISKQDDKTRLKFTHIGLVPQIECFKDCSMGWDYFIKGSLFKLLTEGKGTPGDMK